MPSLDFPCLGFSSSLYAKIKESSPFLDTKTKIVLIISAFFAVAGLILLPFLPPVGGICLATAGLGISFILMFKLIGRLRNASTLDSKIEKIEKSEAAKQLASGITVSPELQKELKKIVPAIDNLQEDDRILSIHYNCDETATFILKTARDLQFRISAPAPRSRLGCNEDSLARRYENLVYAQHICQREHYDSLFVPSIKPIYLKVGGLRRSLLVEKTIQKTEASAEALEPAIRQMVRFLLKTGVASNFDPIPFTPIEGNKLALQNLHHLTESLHLDDSRRDDLEVNLVIAKRNSLLASLDKESMIDIALDELKKLRPIHLSSINAKYTCEEAIEKRSQQIKTAKEQRMKEIENAAHVHAQPQDVVPPPNILGISPEKLGLDLNLKDYAVIRSDGIHSDGICRIITLREVAQAVIDRINQKLQVNPQNPNIVFTPQDMLIGETPSLLSWEKHYHYNMLQGLGYREWPDPNQEPPYWIALILKSLQKKNLLKSFTLYENNPRLCVNLEVLPKPSCA